jgi:hypothetical protein
MSTPRIAAIKETVAASFGITVMQLDSHRRLRQWARPRQVAMYLASRLCGYSLPKIGRAFGDRDHTTVYHAIQVIERLRESDIRVRATVDQLERQLQQELDPAEPDLTIIIEEFIAKLRSALYAQTKLDPSTLFIALNQAVPKERGKPCKH